MESENVRLQRVAQAIGYQLFGATKATHIELEMWERCVEWAREGCVGKCPAIPKRVCIEYERYKQMADKAGVMRKVKHVKQQNEQQQNEQQQQV